MVLSFGQQSRVTTLAAVSFVARRQACLCWLASGGHHGDYATVDTMLGDCNVRWFVVCDERGVPLADLWQLSDAVLVFRAGTTEMIGHLFEVTIGATSSEEVRQAPAPETLREVA